MDTNKTILEINLTDGVVPISRAASSLASLVKHSRSKRQPIIVTQKGYPAGVILDINLFTDLRELAEQGIKYNLETERNMNGQSKPGSAE